MQTDLKPPKELRNAASFIRTGQGTQSAFRMFSNARLRVWVKKCKGSPTGIQTQLWQELQRRKQEGR